MGAYGADEVACDQFQLAASQLPPARPALALASHQLGRECEGIFAGQENGSEKRFASRGY